MVSKTNTAHLFCSFELFRMTGSLQQLDTSTLTSSQHLTVSHSSAFVNTISPTYCLYSSAAQANHSWWRWRGWENARFPSCIEVNGLLPRRLADLKYSKYIRIIKAPELDITEYPTHAQVPSPHNTPIEGLWHWFCETSGWGLRELITDGKVLGLFDHTCDVHRYAQLFTSKTSHSPNWAGPFSTGYGLKLFRRP